MLEPWDGHTEEAVAEREGVNDDKKKDELLKAFNGLLFEGPCVVRFGKGSNHIKVPECKEVVFRTFLAKVKISNKKEEWARECLLQNFVHQKYPGSNDNFAAVFTELEFKGTEGGFGLKVEPKE